MRVIKKDIIRQHFSDTTVVNLTGQWSICFIHEDNVYEVEADELIKFFEEQQKEGV